MFSGSPGSIHLLELVQTDLPGAPDEVDVTRSDHCKSCCPDKSGKIAADGHSLFKEKLVSVIKTGCCPCLYIAKKSTKFFYTFTMGLIIGEISNVYLIFGNYIMKCQQCDVLNSDKSAILSFKLCLLAIDFTFFLFSSHFFNAGKSGLLSDRVKYKPYLLLFVFFTLASPS